MNITPFSLFPAVAHQEKPPAPHAVLVFGERFRSENWDYLKSIFFVAPDLIRDPDCYPQTILTRRSGTTITL